MSYCLQYFVQKKNKNLKPITIFAAVITFKVI